MDQSIGFRDRYYQTRKPKDAAAKTSRRKNKFLVSHENSGKYGRCRWQSRSVSPLPLFALLSLQIKKNKSPHLQDDPTHARPDPCAPSVAQSLRATLFCVPLRRDARPNPNLGESMAARESVCLITAVACGQFDLSAYGRPLCAFTLLGQNEFKPTIRQRHGE